MSCEALQIAQCRRRAIADMLKIEMANGLLRPSNPLRAAADLLALIEFDLYDWYCRDAATVSDTTIEKEIHHSIDAFLRAYAPEDRQLNSGCE